MGTQPSVSHQSGVQREGQKGVEVKREGIRQSCIYLGSFKHVFNCSFLICNIGIIIISTSEGCGETQIGQRML